MIYLKEISGSLYWIGWDDGEGGEFHRDHVDQFFRDKGETPPSETRFYDTPTLEEYYNIYF